MLDDCSKHGEHVFMGADVKPGVNDALEHIKTAAPDGVILAVSATGARQELVSAIKGATRATLPFVFLGNEGDGGVNVTRPFTIEKLGPAIDKAFAAAMKT
jgi:hypothetical protein